MHIETLQEYIEFGKCQNLSMAAKKLYMSQPALSNHIANLEKEIGVELVRRGQMLELTAAGKAFFEGCCEVVSSYDAMLGNVRTLAEKDRQGSIAIKMVFDSLKLTEIIGDFKRENPAVSFKFAKESHAPVIEDVISGGIDCAELYNYSPDPSCSHESLGCLVVDRAPITIVACRDHPLMAQEAVAFEDIQDYPYAMPAGADFSECELSVRRLYQKHGLELRNIHYKVVDSIEDLVFMETRGLEILFLGPHPSLPSSMEYRSFEPSIVQDFCLVFRKDNENPAFKALVAFVEERLGKPTFATDS